jgi:colicin import membrane protein
MAREEGEIKELGKKLAQNPDSMVFVQLADAYRRAGNLEQSVEVCLQGLERHPTYTTARVILGRNYFDLGKLDEAASEFRQIETVDAENILAHRMLGQIALNKGQFADAISRQQRVLALDPDDSTAQELLQQALVQAKQSENAGKPSPAPKAPPVDEHSQALRVADIYIKKRALDKATEVVQEILALNPNHVPAQKKLQEILALKEGAGEEIGNDDKGKAEEEAKRKAEEEAKRKADEDAKRKAEEEAKRKAEEEAKRKAEEEAKRKAEEEAKRKAEEEAKRRAEEEAKRKAEEEAKNKAEEEAKSKAEQGAKRKEGEGRGRSSDKFTPEDILSVIAGSAEDLIENEGSGTKAPKAAGASAEANGVIAAFLKSQAIEASLLLDAKGKVLEGRMDGDSALLGQIAGAVFQSAEKAAKNVGFGGLKQVVIAAEDKRQILFMVLKAGNLVAVTGKDTNVGQLRVAMHDLMKRA